MHLQTRKPTNAVVPGDAACCTITNPAIKHFHTRTPFVQFSQSFPFFVLHCAATPFLLPESSDFVHEMNLLWSHLAAPQHIELESFGPLCSPRRKLGNVPLTYYINLLTFLLRFGADALSSTPVGQWTGWEIWAVENQAHALWGTPEWGENGIRSEEVTCTSSPHSNARMPSSCSRTSARWNGSLRWKEFETMALLEVIRWSCLFRSDF